MYFGIASRSSQSEGWQAYQGSNPDQRFWRPVCYHYTIGLSSLSKIEISIDSVKMVEHFGISILL